MSVGAGESPLGQNGCGGFQQYGMINKSLPLCRNTWDDKETTAGRLFVDPSRKEANLCHRGNWRHHPLCVPQVASGSQKAEELTTIITQWDKKNVNAQSYPHSVSIRPAPKAGEDGHLLDKNV